MLYFISDGIDIKIGFTDRPIEERLAKLQTGNRNRLTVFATIANGTRATEADCHRNWAADRINLEWFNGSEAMRDRIRNLCDQRNSCEDF